MNYVQERFPENMSELVQKCENIIIQIKEQLYDSRCLVVKDLYHHDKGHKQKDFIQKLQVNCNTKLNTKTITNNEVKGLYVFGEVDSKGIVEPVYIGISRTVFRRLYQHTWGTKHNEASFAYLMAKFRLNHKKDRNLLCKNELTFEQQKIKNY